MNGVTPGQELVSEDADCVHIAAGVGVTGADLFGRQVRRGAQNDAGGGDLGFGDRANQSEVGDLDLTAVRDQHVLRLDVAMHQAGRVCHRQAAEHGCEYRGDGVWRHRAALAQQFPQGAALDEFHHEIRGLPAGCSSALVIDGDQAGIAETGDRARLSLKPCEELLVTRVPGFHDLERDWSVKAKVEPAVHRAHPAGGDHGVDAVPTVQDGPDERARLLVGLHKHMLRVGTRDLDLMG